MQLVGYWTSQKEIRDLYQQVYLLRRSPGPLPCRPWQREEAIQDILSSLRSHLHRWEGTDMLEEDQLGLLWLPPGPSVKWNPTAGPKGAKTHTMRPSKRPETHQWALKAAHMLELNIERLSQGVESTQYWCPHSCSSSPLQSRFLDRHERSLDRHERSLSQHRLERCVTFQDPEVEPVLSKRSYRGSWGHSIGTQSEGGNGGPSPVQRPEMVCSQEMAITYPDIRNRLGYPPEPSIRNYEIWLDWQECQLDTPHWWVELTAIPKVEDPRRLAQKICTSFLILAVRCEALPGQDYTVPPSPKCLTRGRFLPNDPSYWDVWQQPLLLTMAYAQALQ